jgi:hypothetical protein
MQHWTMMTQSKYKSRNSLAEVKANLNFHQNTQKRNK